MTGRTALVIAIGTLVFLFQAYVTYRVAFHVGLSQRQKLLQFILIWLFPLVGAAIVRAVLLTDREAPVSGDRDFTEQPPNA